MWLVGGGTVFNREEGKRVASGGRHFRPTSGERLCRVP